MESSEWFDVVRRADRSCELHGPGDRHDAGTGFGLAVDHRMAGGQLSRGLSLVSSVISRLGSGASRSTSTDAERMPDTPVWVHRVEPDGVRVPRRLD
jgi:hypothetical protein